jgi:uncharacterized protein
MSLFAINAADIDVAGRSIDADLPVEWLDVQLAECDVHATAPGKFSARLSRSDNEIVVRGKVHASLDGTCGRCLSVAKLMIDGELSLLLRPAKGSGSDRSTGDARTPRVTTGGATGKGSIRSSAGKESAGKESAGKESAGKESAGKGSVVVAVAGSALSSGKGKGKRAPKAKDLPEYEFAADEADVDTFDGETVVLDDFVREAILLEMPIFPLCSEDCTGIRPATSDAIDEGSEPHVDPRLAPLAALRAVLAQSKAGQGESNDHSGVQPRSADASHRKKTK